MRARHRAKYRRGMEIQGTVAIVTGAGGDPRTPGVPRSISTCARRCASAAEGAATPPLIPPEEVVAAGLDLLREGRAGTIVEMWGRAAPAGEGFLMA
jgi:hypothetical protein